MDFEKYNKEELLNLLRDKVSELEVKDSELKHKDSELNNRNEEIERLKVIIALLKEQLFGTSSEKMSALPGDNTLDEASPPDDEEAINAADKDISVTAHTRGKRSKNGSRKPLPRYLQFVERIYDIPEEERLCNCGSILRHIKDEISEQLEAIPVQLYIVRSIRRKYGNCENKCDEIIKIADMPQYPLPKSIAAPGLLAHVITSKYQDHLPLYRQEQILQRLGIDIARQTLSLWMLKSSELLSPLYNLLLQNICNYDVAYADETPLQVINEPGRDYKAKSYMWAIGGGAPDEFCFYYKYSPSRAHEVIMEILPTFSGYLHCDGYGVYDCYVSKQKEKEINVIQVGCLYHARRKFVEAAKTSKKKGLSDWFLNKISVLTKIETKIKDLSADAKYDVRQLEALPILSDIKSKLKEKKDSVPAKSKIGEAINYTLNQWDKLMSYTLDGRLDISNNRTEREIKQFAIGRKNWMFSYGVPGAICSAIFFSLQATCKCHEINFYLWLKYVLRVIRGYPKDKLQELLPYNVDPALLEAEGVLPTLQNGTPPESSEKIIPPDTS